MPRQNDPGNTDGLSHAHNRMPNIHRKDQILNVFLGYLPFPNVHAQRLTEFTYCCRNLFSRTTIFSHAYKEISGNFKAQEAAGHAWGDLEKVWYDALVETADAFLCRDDPDGVKYPLVFIAHAFHLIDLKPAAENITATVSVISRSVRRVPYRG